HHQDACHGHDPPDQAPSKEYRPCAAESNSLRGLPPVCASGPRRRGPLASTPMKRLRPHPAPQRTRDDALKVSGLRPVEALFAARPQAIRRLFFTREMAAAAKPICAALARTRRPFRQVEEAELQ